MLERGTELSEFCSHALLSLEVLIHPRALPLIDYSSDFVVSDGLKHRFGDNIYSGGPKFNTSFSGVTFGEGPVDPESDEDDLYKSWLGNDDEVDVAAPLNPGNNANVAETLAVASKDPSAVTFVKEAKESGNDENVAKTLEPQETIQYPGEAIAREDQTIRAVSTDLLRAQSDMVIADSNAMGTMDNTGTVTEDTLATRDEDFEPTEQPFITILNIEKGKGIMFGLDADSSEESIPDIVDEEPDSD